MPENYDVIVFFWIFAQFGVVERTESGRRVYKSYFFSKNNLLPYKNWKQN